MPTSRDMAIFVLTTITQPITLPLAHARGKYVYFCMLKLAVIFLIKRKDQFKFMY